MTWWAGLVEAAEKCTGSISQTLINIKFESARPRWTTRGVEYSLQTSVMVVISRDGCMRAKTLLDVTLQVLYCIRTQALNAEHGIRTSRKAATGIIGLPSRLGMTFEASGAIPDGASYVSSTLNPAMGCVPSHFGTAQSSCSVTGGRIERQSRIASIHSFQPTSGCTSNPPVRVKVINANNKSIAMTVRKVQSPLWTESHSL